MKTEEIIKQMNLICNQQIQPYYSVENVFKQRIYDDIDISNFIIGQLIGNGKYSNWHIC